MGDMNARLHEQFVGESLCQQENLTFGVSTDDPRDKSEERVIQVCRKLGLPQRLLSRTALAQTAFNWLEVLSEHELQLLTFARGFIANPNVLVMHTPTLGFDQQMATHVLTTMREFVDCKGVALDDSQRASRRPRTCIFSSVRAQGLQVADQVVLCDRNGFHEVPKEVAPDALESMLLAHQVRLRRDSVRPRALGVGGWSSQPWQQDRMVPPGPAGQCEMPEASKSAQYFWRDSCQDREHITSLIRIA
ncbi:unnamed protein product [Prorocentrum cordatum]|uniref:Uncharacterized protein n=1 Tax=Prorocentrum cordatum TaxID=2364126 RepID=A0ABN9TPL5_9DINO|nr:unnamed protein product [Polarella glacialis]